MSWGDELAEWWLEEVTGDPAYGTEVMPLAMELTAAIPGERWLDLGCGDGRGMLALTERGVVAIGCDISPMLAGHAAVHGPVVVSRLPDLSWLADGSVDGALAVLVLEHVAERAALFAAVARVVRPGGRFAVVVNHPVFTAPGSAPVVDPDDGEVLWRWGRYFESGVTFEPAGSGTVAFHHRSLGATLEEAAAAGWVLDRCVEQPVGAERAGFDTLLAGQLSVPRLLGVAWRRAAA